MLQTWLPLTATNLEFENFIKGKNKAGTFFNTNNADFAIPNDYFYNLSQALITVLGEGIVRLLMVRL